MRSESDCECAYVLCVRSLFYTHIKARIPNGTAEGTEVENELQNQSFLAIKGVYIASTNLTLLRLFGGLNQKFNSS